MIDWIVNLLALVGAALIVAGVALVRCRRRWWWPGWRCWRWRSQ